MTVGHGSLRETRPPLRFSAVVEPETRHADSKRGSAADLAVTKTPLSTGRKTAFLPWVWVRCPPHSPRPPPKPSAPLLLPVCARDVHNDSQRKQGSHSETVTQPFHPPQHTHTSTHTRTHTLKDSEAVCSSHATTYAAHPVGNTQTLFIFFLPNATMRKEFLFQGKTADVSERMQEDWTHSSGRAHIHLLDKWNLKGFLAIGHLQATRKSSEPPRFFRQRGARARPCWSRRPGPWQQVLQRRPGRVLRAADERPLLRRRDPIQDWVGVFKPNPFTQ